MKTLRQYLLIAGIAVASFGSILWNGAGFSLPDDLAAAQLRCCGFRPLLGLSYQFNAAFGGWMVTNLILHVTAALLLLAVTRNLLAGALFAAHPMAADAVASVAGRSALILAVMVLAGAAVTRKHRRLGLAVLGLGALLAAGFHPEYIKGLESPRFMPHVHKMASMVGGYLVPKMIVPRGMSADPDVKHSTVREVAGWLTLPLVAPMIPYFLVPLPDVLFEHRAYLALGWFSAVIGLFLVRVRLEKVGWLVLPCFIALSIVRAGVYSSPIAAFEDAALKSPEKARVRVNLAGAYAAFNRVDDVERELELAVRLDPESPLAWKNLAVAKLFKGDSAGAIRIFEEKQTLLQKER